MRKVPRAVSADLPRHLKTNIDTIKWDSPRIMEYSMDYIEELEAALNHWSSSKDAFILPQFCAMYGVGVGQLNLLVMRHPTLRDAYEVALSRLAVKWYGYLMGCPDISQSQEKLAFKYIRMYDRQEKYQEMAERLDMMQLEMDSAPRAARYAIEDYSKMKE